MALVGSFSWLGRLLTRRCVPAWVQQPCPRLLPWSLRQVRVQFCSDKPSVTQDEAAAAAAADPPRRMAIMFTCKVCGTRSTRSFSRRAYDHGVVIVQCPGCENRHLIADRLDWFQQKDGASVEDFLAARGEQVRRLQSNGLLVLNEKGSESASCDDAASPASIAPSSKPST